MAKLTAKQQCFVNEYLIDLNATQAAIRAGYSPKTATEQASRLLSNVNIRACVDKAMAERSKRTGVTAERVVLELACLGFVNAKDLVNMTDGSVLDSTSRDDTAAIASVKVKTTPGEYGNSVEREVKLSDKTKALELLGKHLGMFTDNINLTGDVGVQIINDIPKTTSTPD